jgi:3-oxoacyl-[acyl-carrier protein] reductase
MRDRKWGRIITSTSSGVVAPIPNLAISNTLRTSLLGWSKSLAREVAADGVTVNVVVPGRIATSRTQFLDDQRAQREAKSVDDVRAESSKTIPMGRYGDPEEYAAAVAFLASAKASYITGSSLRIDGGLLASI